MISGVRGIRDIVPGQVERWQYVEMTARRVCELYGYTEIRTPIIEREELFTKGTGQTTDIVQKEMYSFTDRGDERVTLRPEATPGVVRAFVEHALEQAMRPEGHQVVHRIVTACYTLEHAAHKLAAVIRLAEH